ncbi:MAG: hypothetical protein CME61_00365, partial [Halobacteriovoraceae bacterium]|nr:hypothetical protein [Halobacteriovoraceae bacterium]
MNVNLNELNRDFVEKLIELIKTESVDKDQSTTLRQCIDNGCGTHVHLVHEYLSATYKGLLESHGNNTLLYINAISAI